MAFVQVQLQRFRFDHVHDILTGNCAGACQSMLSSAQQSSRMRFRYEETILIPVAIPHFL